MLNIIFAYLYALFANRIMCRYVLLGIVTLSIFSCNEDVNSVDCQKSGPVVSLGAVVNAASCSVADGSINVSASAGKEPYVFSLNDLAGQSSGKFENLAAGIYRVSVRDANGCIASVDNVNLKADDFTFTATITPDNSCLSGSGAVVVDVTSGNPPYTFSLGNGAFTDSNSFSALSEGNHTISVKDNNGCSVFLLITIPHGETGVSWTNEIKPIMQVSCFKSGCHNGSSRPDLTKYENAKFYATSIKSKTKDKSMPRDGTLSQEQIDLIGCWVDDGAQEN